MDEVRIEKAMEITKVLVKLDLIDLQQVRTLACALHASEVAHKEAS